MAPLQLDVDLVAVVDFGDDLLFVVAVDLVAVGEGPGSLNKESTCAVGLVVFEKSFIGGFVG